MVVILVGVVVISGMVVAILFRRTDHSMPCPREGYVAHIPGMGSGVTLGGHASVQDAMSCAEATIDRVTEI